MVEYKRRQSERIKNEPKNIPELDFEKDQRGLIGVYEDEYLKKVQGVDVTKNKTDSLKD